MCAGSSPNTLALACLKPTPSPPSIHVTLLLLLLAACVAWLLLLQHVRAHTPSHWLLLYTRLGYSMTRTEPPRLLGGRFFLNLARTAPVLPCWRVTLPQMQRK